MGADDTIRAIDNGGNTLRAGQVDYKDYYRQYVENQQQPLRPNSIWVNEGAYIT